MISHRSHITILLVFIFLTLFSFPSNADILILEGIVVKVLTVTQSLSSTPTTNSIKSASQERRAREGASIWQRIREAAWRVGGSEGGGYGEGTEGEVTEKEKERIRLIPPRKSLLNYYATWMHGEGVFYCNLCDFRTNEPGNCEAYEKILEHIHSVHPEEVAIKDHDSTPHIPRKWWQWFRKEKEEKVEMKAGTGNVMFVKSSPDSESEPRSEAAKWYRKAAEQGLAAAQGDLGVMYYEGIGVPQDYSEAAKWYRKAADQGLPEAQYFLGVMYHKGQGVPQDYVLAHMWLNLAALRFPASEKKNQEVANKDRDITASEMTPAQIAEAQKLAREWKPKLELGRGKVKDQEKKTTPAEKETEKELSPIERWQREDR